MTKKNQAILDVLPEKKIRYNCKELIVLSNFLHHYIHGSSKLAITSNVLMSKQIKRHSLHVLSRSVNSIFSKRDQTEKIILFLTFIRVDFVC